MISQTQLEAATGVHWQREMDVPHIVESPGQHPRHYAPRTPFYVLTRDEDTPAGRGRIIDMPQDRAAYAASLYAALHNADKEGWDWIAVLRPPHSPEWAGIHDRLKRASFIADAE
jgi:L-threonylcarbamoyladenylate synthase